MHLPPVLGLIMAGGQSTRMGGGYKCLLKLGEQTLLQRVVARARLQVSQLVLNANGTEEEFTSAGLPIRQDCVSGYLGPLAGILTGMRWAQEAYPECRWIASFASDTPFFPMDLVARLYQGLLEEGAEIAVAKSGEQLHPVFGLWPVSLAEDLHQALVKEDVRRMGAWLKRHSCAQVDFDLGSIDPFFNINTPADMALAQEYLSGSE